MGRTDHSIHPKSFNFNGVRTGESVAESASALAAAAGKDLAAVSGSHSLPEAMDLLSVELLGLVGTLRHLYTPPEKLCSTAKTLQRVKLGCPEGQAPAIIPDKQAKSQPFPIKYLE